MSDIDHQLIRLAALRGQCRENHVEHAHAIPADEPVGDCLRRPVLRRSIAQPQAITDQEDHAADDPAIIDPRHPVRQREMWLDPAHLLLRQSGQITHGSASSHHHCIN